MPALSNRRPWILLLGSDPGLPSLSQTTTQLPALSLATVGRRWSPVAYVFTWNSALWGNPVLS
jgi:hypothetical protein